MAPAAQAGELPPLLEGLDLSAEQRGELFRLQADLEREVGSFLSAAAELGRSVAGAARRCKGETPFLDMDAERVIRLGEEARESVVNAVQRLHEILTPVQRRELSARLLESSDWTRRERRNEARTKALEPTLDLTAVQVVQVLVKARRLRSEYADKAEPWQEHFNAGAERFARDDFQAHEEPFARAPVVPLAMGFLRTGLRLLIPILEPKQCEALGRVIDDALDERERRSAVRTRGR